MYTTLDNNNNLTYVIFDWRHGFATVKLKFYRRIGVDSEKATFSLYVDV